MDRSTTIADLAARGLLVRVWCLRCARGREFVASDVPARFATLPLDAVLRRMSCRSCRRCDAILIVPGRPPPCGQSDREYTAANAVAAFFHSFRAMRKREKKALRDQRRGAALPCPTVDSDPDHVVVEGHDVPSRLIGLGGA